jgi:hypothetical protein
MEAATALTHIFNSVVDHEQDLGAACVVHRCRTLAADSPLDSTISDHATLKVASAA